MLLSKGTTRRTPSSFDFYIKLDNEDFGWWRLENLELSENKRMMVRLTDEMVLMESQFDIYNPEFDDICPDCKGWGYIVDDQERRKEHCHRCE